MAGKPTRLCNRTGCRGLVQNGICSVCGTSGKVKEFRPGPRQRGYTKRWERYSRRYRRRNPLCVVCLAAARTTSVEGKNGVTDHIIPHRGDMKLFWDPNNHQSLCKPCHDRKTGRGE